MDLGLEGTVVLITGGSKGIGLACARAFGREGAKVAITSRDPANLDAAVAALRADGIEAFGAPADLRDERQADRVARAVEAALGPIGVLVNSAGAAERTPPADLNCARWHAAMEAKYFTYLHAIDAVLPGMAERGAGAIVNVIGMGGKVAAPTHIPGGAANAALMLATAGLANAFGAKGVRVNAVNPGLVATERMQQGFEAESRLSGKSVDDIRQSRTRAMPLGRLAVAEDVADVVLFLASKRAGYVSGAVVPVDGAATPVL